MKTLTTSTPARDDTDDGLVRPVGAWATQASLAAIGAYICSGSAALGIWSPQGPGPGFFPLVLAGFLVLLSGIWFLQTPRHDERPPASQRTIWRHGAVTIASLIVLGTVMDILGFQVSMFVFLLFHLRLRGKVSWLTSVLVALGGSVATFHLFSDFLLVPLPLATLPPFTLLGL